MELLFVSVHYLADAERIHLAHGTVSISLATDTLRVSNQVEVEPIANGGGNPTGEEK